ncbi:MAG: hypothetical protein ACJA2W_001501 [Planctomycetota bacterium]
MIEVDLTSGQAFQFAGDGGRRMVDEQHSDRHSSAVLLSGRGHDDELPALAPGHRQFELLERPFDRLAIAEPDDGALALQ